MSDAKEVLSAVASIILIAVALILIGTSVERSRFQTQAVHLGHAEWLVNTNRPAEGGKR